MTKKHNVIEINGRRYDASTGVPLDSGKSSKKDSPATTNQEAVSIPVRVAKIDDLASHPKTHVRRSQPKNLKSHTPQPAQTLMRQAVSKPQSATRTIRIKATAQLDVPAKGVAVIVKPSVSRLDASRLHRSTHVKRSHLISRFSRRQILAEPDFVTTTPSLTLTAGTIAQTSQAVSHAKGKRPKTTADVLEMALQNATSHLQPPVKLAKRHRVWHRHHATAHQG